MLIAVYENERRECDYINVKDVKRYFIENSDEDSLYDLKVETYTKEIYYICWYITFNEYDYIIHKISKSIGENKNIIEVLEFQRTFEDLSFYNYCSKKILKFDEKSQDKLFKVLEESSELAETDNLKFYVEINKLSDENSKNIFNKLRMDYEKEIALLDSCLAKCLRIL